MKRFLSAIAVPAAMLACATTPDTTSTISGQLLAETYASPPVGVVAIDERGVRTAARFRSNGRFSLDLARHHTYSVHIATAAGEEPLVFPRVSGRLDPTFAVRSGAASVEVGAVRHLDFIAADAVLQTTGGLEHRVVTFATSSELPGETGEGEPGECVDGVIAGSGLPCADDDAAVQCEGEEEEGEADGAEAEVDDDDLQCEDGVNALTGGACEDDEDESVPALGALSVAQHNVPDSVGGCADEEEEGEHE